MNGDDVGSRPAATASASVQVKAPLAVTFDRFVHDIDRWWRRGPKFRHGVGALARIHLEARLGGRFFETWNADGDAREFELGHVTLWEPPQRFAFTWRNATFAPLEQTSVEVAFAAVGTGTLVTVRHFGWERLRPDHPARHGLAAAAFAGELGMWWGDQLTALRTATP